MASTSTAGRKRKIDDMGAVDGFAPSAPAAASKVITKPSYDVFLNNRGPDFKHTLAKTLYTILTAMALSVFLDSEELEYGDFLLRTLCLFLFFSFFISPASLIPSGFMACTSTAGSQRKIDDTGAFDGVAPSAPADAPKVITKPSYDVFLNHRGPDVKHTLAKTIYTILTAMALSVFLDSEELEYGDFLPNTIEAAMTSALIHIAIFSKSYAGSPWCLAELSFMLKSGAKIIPIFYNVEPTDLRYIKLGKGLYAEAVRKHEEKGRYSVEQLQEWKEALYKVSFYTGQIIKIDGQIIKTDEDEKKLLKNIVAIVLKEKNNVPLTVAKHPVGLKEIVEDFELTTLRTYRDIQIVGIWGMGGSGKTTLAQELYNKYSSSKERRSFIFNVRDSAAKGLLHSKQIQLLKDLGVQNETFDNIEQGKAILTSRLRSVSVLFVFDDVDHKDQLDALLPIKDSLGGDSLILVTTRELGILRSWGIRSVYKMKPLDSLFGKRLFCWHAFSQSYPSNGFDELVEKFVKVCNGLPLSLKVFGGQLNGDYPSEYWNFLLDKISRILPNDIKNILRVSYDALDVEEKEMFLDIACFFIGKDIGLAIEVWNGSRWSGLHGWETLQNKCLVELDNENHITMHDHLRDLGRDIANQHQPSRLYPEQQITDVDNLLQQRIAVRGIVMEKPFGERRWFQGPASSLVGLKIFVIAGDYWNGVIGEISRELVWLSWSHPGLRNLPSQLSLENLRALQLDERYGTCNTLEELWTDEKNAPLQLRELVVSHCNNFWRFPNSIGRLKELKKMVIDNNNSISSLPEEFCHLQSLEHLKLFGYHMVKLPDNFGNLKNLRYLDLWGCDMLEKLPVSFRKLMLLQHLNLDRCHKLVLVSEDFQYLTKLEYLNLCYCPKVEELPRHIKNQTSMTELYLGGMQSLKEVPVTIGQFSRLRKLEIGSESLTYLPSSLGQLSCLTHLEIQGCSKLKCLPRSLGQLSSLTHLEIQHCSKLECLPRSLGDLVLLEHLIISFCPIREVDILAASLPVHALGSLKKMELRGLKVGKIAISEGLFPRLERLDVSENDELMEIEALPPNLQWLSIESCGKLQKLPSFARLTSLRKLRVYNCGRIEKIKGLEKCTRLETLIVESRCEMPAIESLEEMGILRTLELRASEGSVSIKRCIQTIQKMPGEMTICTRAVPDAASILNNVFPPDLLVDSISNKKLDSSQTLVQKSFSNGDAILLCFVINCVSSTELCLSEGSYAYIEEGKCVWIVFCTQRSNHQLLTVGEITIADDYDEGDEESNEVEKGMLVRGEAKQVFRVLKDLLPAVVTSERLTS